MASLTRRQFALVTAAGMAAAQTGGDSPELAAGFREPPTAARPSTYWVWLNGFTDPERLTWELEELKKAGFSAAYILEIGEPRKPQVPAGPAYMSAESVNAIAHAVREAARLGIEVGITNASSWNSGGSWVEPRHASKGLYASRISVAGPARFSEILPMPKLPAGVPRTETGAPAFYSEVGVLAVPESERLPGYDFLFDLAPGAPYTVDRVTLHNTGEQFAAKDFIVFASATGTDTADFREVLRAALERRAGRQEFRFPPVRARYLKLRVLSGYDPSGRIELAEFEGWSAEGKNVVGLVQPDGRKIEGGLLRFTAESGLDRDWLAINIYDSRLAGAAGSWAADGPLPPLVRNPAAILDLSDKLDPQGRLTWDVPAGRWSLYRFIAANTGQRLVAPSPKSAGLIIDHFSAEAARMHTDYMLGRLHTALPDFRKTALRYFYACSYEVRGSIWTPNLPEEFRRRRGYDIKPFLPVLAGAVVENEDVSQRFRVDYRRTLSDLFIDQFYRATREIANRHGLRLVAEAGGPGWPLHQVPVDALKASGALDIARGEFWTRDRGIWVVKETACAAHIYGQNLVQMESFTSTRHWQDGPGDLKPIADRAFCEGANHIVWHTMAHVPRQAGQPGWRYHAGTHVGPAETWWPLGKPFFDYLARCSWMLRQGLFVADICYYYGEQGFNFVQAKRVDPSLGPGFDYDVANSDVILTRMQVKDGRIVLPDGMSYAALVLPDRPDMDLEVLMRLEQLVRDGAAIVGRRPERAVTLQDHSARDRKVQELAARLWGACDGQQVRENRYGAGKVYWGVPLREVLAQRGIGPDFQYKGLSGEADLDFIHRHTGRADLYFVRNRAGQPVEAECVFRIERRAPELWDPRSGEARPVPAYAAAAGGTRLVLELPPNGAVFVVFRQPAAERPSRGPLRAPRRDPAWTREIAGAWQVAFPEGWGAPASTTFDRLASWTEHSDPAVRYFSGIATYRKQFDLPPEVLRHPRLFLDLGKVGAIARVKLNGQEVGIAWTAPFRVEIGKAARPGTNQLEVEVANTWSNRLTGDAQGFGKYTNTNIPWTKDTPLLASGLLGPVRLLAGGQGGLSS